MLIEEERMVERARERERLKWRGTESWGVRIELLVKKASLDKESLYRLKQQTRKKK